MIKKSLNRKLVVVFSSILVLVVISNIVINSLLLPKVYRNKKISAMQDLYYSIAEQYALGNDNDAVTKIVKDVLSAENIRVFIWDEHDMLVVDSLPLSDQQSDDEEKKYQENSFPQSDFGDMGRPFLKRFNFRRNEMFIFFMEVAEEKIIQQSEDFLIFSFSSIDDIDEGNFCLRAYFDNNYKILIQMPFSSIEQAVGISNTLLLIVGLAMLIVGIIVVAVTSRTIAKPIKELSDIAKSMENLDFSRQYIHNRRDEIGSLGDSINSLSSKLEHTINELCEKNEALLKDNQLKSRIDTLRKEFIANASHELKTPVALISGYAEGLRDNIANDEETRRIYTDVIIEEAEKMNHIIHQMLDLMEIDGSEDIIAGTEFDLSELVGVSVNSFDLLIKSNNINLTYETEGNCVVFGEYWRIHQAVSNYISNAINHVDDNKNIKIKVNGDSDKVILSVFNSGSQIPEDDIENIWERFYKVDKAHTREYGGTGLGLSIVRSVIELHKGEYGVINHRDGVEFYFLLKKENNSEN